MSLSEETLTLQRAAHDLMYLGMDGSPVYSDDLSRRNGEVYRLTTALYNSGVKGSTVEERANICLALLMGYNASFVDHGEKQKHVQEVLDRCWDILEVLPASLLKLRLLTACYGEVFDEPLADEGRAIIASWNSVSFTTEQQEAIEEFQNVVDNPYPWEYIEDSASEEVDVKYIKADFRVRHFEDAEVNGILENEKAPLMPFVIGRRWLIEVDIKKGCVLNWLSYYSINIYHIFNTTHSCIHKSLYRIFPYFLFSRFLPPQLLSLPAFSVRQDLSVMWYFRYCLFWYAPSRFP